MAKKRKVMDIVQYDYASKEEFLKDAEQKKANGWVLIGPDTGSQWAAFEHGEVHGSEYWTYTAYFAKSPYM